MKGLDKIDDLASWTQWWTRGVVTQSWNGDPVDEDVSDARLSTSVGTTMKMKVARHRDLEFHSGVGMIQGGGGLMGRGALRHNLGIAQLASQPWSSNHFLLEGSLSRPTQRA